MIGLILSILNEIISAIPVSKMVGPVKKMATSIYRVGTAVVGSFKKLQQLIKSFHQMGTEAECNKIMICQCQKKVPRIARSQRIQSLITQVEDEIEIARQLLLSMEQQLRSMSGDNASSTWSVSAVRKRLGILYRWNQKMKRNVSALADVDFVAWDSFIQGTPYNTDGFNYFSSGEENLGRGEEQEGSQNAAQESKSYE